MNLKGRNALVTGSSRGIGKGCAIEMARAGANVAVNYFSHAAEGEAVATEIRSLGSRALVLQGDVSSQQRIEEMVAETAAEFGSLDLFVSNAVFSDRQLMLEADLDGFRRTIDVGMWGAFYGLRAAAMQMVKQGHGGSIVIISSPHAVIPIPTAMAYNMAKAAIDHMARTAAIELAEHRIRVNIVHPGWIDTPGERKFFTEEQLAVGGSKLPWKRLGRPDEIGKSVTFILSDDADYMTGSTITVDGGVSLPWWSSRSDGNL
ncbi:MAG: SDR family oxidoreductase [Planctomycetes bacterium]|nr:SDR family oxidoreductase [Planctomycetota bacterium]